LEEEEEEREKHILKENKRFQAKRTKGGKQGLIGREKEERIFLKAPPPPLIKRDRGV
jgi:hypothetical protein